MIKYLDRKTKEELIEDTPGEGVLEWLYGSSSGKFVLEVLFKKKILSNLIGWYMNSGLSKNRIQKFLDEYEIDMSNYLSPENGFNSFNEFFIRKIKAEVRPIGKGIVSPADGKILAYQNIKDLEKIYIKGSKFSLNEFIGNKSIAEKYKDGSLVIVRLAPTDYHRYHFPASGIISDTKLIKGDYYSVSPLALKNKIEIFCRNVRTISTLKTIKFGNIIISEVGATFVGSIVQTYKPHTSIIKGGEKGYFEFGGSTVVLLFEKDKIRIDEDIIENTNNRKETSILMGETIAKSFK